MKNYGRDTLAFQRRPARREEGNRLRLEPGSVTVGVTQGHDAGDEVVAVTAVNAITGLVLGTITYGEAEPTGWLSASLGGDTTTPSTITLTFNSSILVPGVYQAHVPITGTGTTGLSQVDVTVVVAAPVSAGVQRDVSPLGMLMRGRA